MSNIVIDKYLTKKKKDLVEYAKILESIITIKDNLLWTTKQEFTQLASEVVEEYVKRFYFDNNIHRDNPMEYSNDNINFVLKSFIEYCRLNDKTNILQEKKNETFLLSVIICAACYADISSNAVDGDYQDTKNKFKYLLQYFQKTDILKIKIDKTVINNLFTKIKNNISKEDKFLKALFMENAFNEYWVYTKEPTYYMTSFYYKVDGLENYDATMVKSINQGYKDKYLNMSYELLGVEILKELITNNDMKKYLLPITSTALRKDAILNCLDDDIIKNYFRILINYDDIKDYKESIAKLEARGFKFVYEFLGNEEVSANTFLRNMDVIITEEFKRKNEDKMYSWKNQGINFIIKNNEEDVQ